MTATTFRVTLCDACVWTDANGAPEWDTDAVPLSRLDGYAVGPDMACGCVESGPHFGTWCDGCNTALGGSRFCYVAVLR